MHVTWSKYSNIESLKLGQRGMWLAVYLICLIFGSIVPVKFLVSVRTWGFWHNMTSLKTLHVCSDLWNENDMAWNRLQFPSSKS